ncbi:hypothetical protein Tco_0110559 [Tanacetum coccineum]
MGGARGRAYAIDGGIWNQGASIKTLEIEIGQMSKVLQERGFESLPSSTETNPRDHVKSISTNVEAYMTQIRRIESSIYAVSAQQNLMSSLSTITYTSVYTDSEPWRFQWVFDEELEAPQSPRQAPPSLDYVPGPEHPPSPDYVPALSSGYIANSDLEEDPADYPADGGEEEEEEESSRAIWRVASPTTHHSSKTPSLPLLLPPTTHRDDLTKEDMPLQKRARFTAPTCRFEVGESSSAAAARQAGHTLAHRVNYGLIDTVDASIRAAKSRAMTAIGEDNRALLKAQVSILIRERRFVELVRTARGPEPARDPGPEDGPADAGSSFVYFTKMPPKRTATTTTLAPMTDAQIKVLIAQGVADALAEHEANRSRNGDDSHNSGSDGRRRMPVVRECTYSDFLKCQHLNFKGTKGVVSLTQWFEKMESVFHISNCTVACQIKFSTCTLLGSALTWAHPTGHFVLILRNHLTNNGKTYFEEARAEQNLVEPSIECNVKYELDGELLKELRSNSYSGRVEEDVVGHIAKILEILDLTKVAEVRNNEGIMDEDVSSDDDRDHTNSSMITKPELKIGEEFLKILHDNSFNDKDELRLYVFSKLLSRDAEKWLNSERTTTTWKELSDKLLH